MSPKQNVKPSATGNSKRFFLFSLQDHIQEVMDKWESIDDEIWAKIIVLERNRRVAKAYARAPVLTVNGSDDGFDGFRIGVAGFDNPMRDPTTEDIIRNIGQVGYWIVARRKWFRIFVPGHFRGLETE